MGGVRLVEVCGLGVLQFHEREAPPPAEERAAQPEQGDWDEGRAEEGDSRCYEVAGLHVWECAAKGRVRLVEGGGM